MKCQYCDNELPYGAARCPSCGAPALIPQPAPQPYPQQSVPVQYPQQYPPQGVPVQYPQQVAAPYAPQPGIPQFMTPPKTRTSYILFAVFLGGLGMHNFYAGYSGRGTAQLLITVLTLGFGGIISGIWAIVEACVVTKSADGRPMI